MLLRSIGLVMVVVFAFVGCGPSAGQIKTARTARYKVTAAQAFQAGVAALKSNSYKVTVADPIAGKAVTEPRWYEADGTYAAEDARGAAILQEGAIGLAIELSVVAEGDAFRVEVIPRASEFRSGYENGYPLKPDDPAMPGFVIGKIDNLYLAIYETLKKDAVAPGT